MHQEVDSGKLGILLLEYKVYAKWIWKRLTFKLQDIIKLELWKFWISFELDEASNFFHLNFMILYNDILEISQWYSRSKEKLQFYWDYWTREQFFNQNNIAMKQLEQLNDKRKKKLTVLETVRCCFFLLE